MVPSFKEKYLSARGNNASGLDELRKIEGNFEISLIAVRKQNKNISKQVLEDFVKVVAVFHDQAVIGSIAQVSEFLKKKKCDNVVLTHIYHFSYLENLDNGIPKILF